MGGGLCWGPLHLSRNAEERADPYPTPLHISRKRLTEGSEASWALNRNGRKLTLGPSRVSPSPTGGGGGGGVAKESLLPRCTEHTEAQVQGRRAERGRCSQRTPAAHGSQLVLPEDPEIPRVSESEIKEVIGLPGAPLPWLPKIRISLAISCPMALRELGVWGAQQPPGPECSKPRLGEGEALCSHQTGKPQASPSSSGNPSRRWPLALATGLSGRHQRPGT